MFTFSLFAFVALIAVVTSIAINGETPTTKITYCILMFWFIIFFMIESIKSLLRQWRGTLRPFGSKEDLAELHRICSLTPEQAKQEGFTVVYDAERDGGPIRVDSGETITITREKPR